MRFLSKQLCLALATVSLLATIIMGPAVMANERYTWYFVRHAEKGPEKTDPELSAIGQQRAEQLAKLLIDSDLAAIYSTPYKRTQQTAQPLAQQLDIKVESYAARASEQLLELLQQRQQNSLIVGHSNTIPALVRLAGGHAEDLTEQHYGDMFVIEFQHGQITANYHRRVELP